MNNMKGGKNKKLQSSSYRTKKKDEKEKKKGEKEKKRE
jgi:hypothetical protein